MFSSRIVPGRMPDWDIVMLSLSRWEEAEAKVEAGAESGAEAEAEVKVEVETEAEVEAEVKEGEDVEVEGRLLRKEI